MIERELVPFKAYKDRGSKIPASRIPLDPMLCKRIIELAIDKFLKTLNPVYIETLIYIWLAQSGAKEGRKMVSVRDVFAIRLEDLTTTKDVRSFDKIQRVISLVKVARNKSPLYVSSALIQLIKSYVDKRRELQPILSMERSSLENYLQKLTGELVIDQANFPITPETFLEKISSFGRRCVINNQAVLSSSVEASTAI